MSDLHTELNFVADDLKALPFEDEYLSRFGARLSLGVHPRGRGVLPVGLGPLNTNGVLYLGAEIERPATEGGGRWSLPLQYPAVFDKDGRAIREPRLTRTATSLTLDSDGDHPGVALRWTFTAPFWPRDLRTTTAPYLDVVAEARNDGDAPVTVRLVGALEDLAETRTTEGDAVVQGLRVAANFRGPETKPGKALHYELALDPLTGDGLAALEAYVFETRAARWTGHARRVTLAPGEHVRVAWTFASVLRERGIVTRFGVPCDLAYQALFDGVAGVLAFARDGRDDVLAKARAFDDLFERSSLPAHVRRFVYANLHVFFGATWLLRDPDGRVFFTNYEGGTGYFSTIDVEYNLAPFYALFWPELLSDQLELWAETYARGNVERPFTAGPAARVMPHDCGGGFEIDEQIYILGPMPVEENANYLLLHDLYHRATGDLAPFRRHAELCRALADHNLAADANGNGLPNVGTNNTLDCFEDLMKDTPDQVFLGLKAAAGSLALAELLEAAGHGELAESYRAHAALVRDTVEARAWAGDHYVVTIAEPAPLGWDQASPLTTNGLAYRFFTGRDPILDPERILVDLDRSRADYTMWPSMGVWRDMIGRYLGRRPATRYDFRPDFRDDMYPRSANAVFMLQADGAVAVDVSTGRVEVGGEDGRWPLPQFADWASGRVPWLVVDGGLARIEDATDALEGVTVTVRGPWGGATR